jgi:hypothetical protein
MKVSNRGSELSVGGLNRPKSFGIVSAFAELVKPLFNCPGLSEAPQIDVIQKIETSNLHLYDIHILERDPFTLLRNISIPSAFIKGGLSCNINENQTVVFQFKNHETMALTKTSMEKTLNEMKFIGRQDESWRCRTNGIIR